MGCNGMQNAKCKVQSDDGFFERHCYESTALVGAEDHFGPWAGVGTGPYTARSAKRWMRGLKGTEQLCTSQWVQRERKADNEDHCGSP